MQEVKEVADEALAATPMARCVISQIGSVEDHSPLQQSLIEHWEVLVAKAVAMISVGTLLLGVREDRKKVPALLEKNILSARSV